MLMTDAEKENLKIFGLLNIGVRRKYCPECHSERILDHDNWHYYLSHGRNICDECVRVEQRWFDSGPNGREHTPERKLAQKLRREKRCLTGEYISKKEKLYGLQCAMWSRAKYRAKKCRVPFDIVPEDIIIPEYDPIGVRLKVNKGGHQDNSASLDRVKPEIGYVNGNIQVVSYLYNRIKNNKDGKTLIDIGTHVEYLNGNNVKET